MASIIKLKRSSTSGSVPTTSDLVTGEVAVNLFDRKLYVSNGVGVTAIGGEDFRLTSQTGGEGAYIKLLGDTTNTSNTVLLRGASGITVAKDANGSISVSSSAGTDLNNYIANTNPRISALETEDGDLWTGITGTNTALRTLISDRIQVANAAATYQTITVERAALANTNAYIATKTTESTALSRLANTNAYIATKLDSSSYTTADVRSKAALANTNAYIAGVKTIATNRLGQTATVQISGDVAGGPTAFSGNTVNISVTQQNNSVDLGTHTTGNYVATVSGTANEITVSGSGSETAAVTIGLPDDVTVTGQLNVGENVVVTGNTSIGGDLEVSGDLTVTGGLTYLSTSTVYTDDGMMKLSANNAGDVTDTGVYAKYVVSGNSAVQYTGYFRDASDSGTFKFYTGLDVEPTGTVDVSDTGYSLAQVDCVIDGGSY